jgi:hypothetical protein
MSNFCQLIVVLFIVLYLIGSSLHLAAAMFREPPHSDIPPPIILLVMGLGIFLFWPALAARDILVWFRKVHK